MIRELGLKVSEISSPESISHPDCFIDAHSAITSISLSRDPVALIEAQETCRIRELLPLRHHRMNENAFAFYRGSALLMTHDLATYQQNSGINVQLCGDAHLGNFGLFAAPNRSLHFDIDDFDETYPGPFEWDLYRLATSFRIALDVMGHSNDSGHSIVECVAKSYRQAMRRYANLPEIEIWHERPDEAWLEATLETISGKKGVKQFKQYIRKARNRNRWSTLEKFTSASSISGEREFLSKPPILIRIPLEKDELEIQQAVYDRYKITADIASQNLINRYRVVDVGHKIVGVGSVGLAAYVYLMKGPHPDDFLVLQIKEAVASVLESYLPRIQSQTHGQRVINGQRIIQSETDLFLGWVSGPHNKAFYVRQLRDMKFKPDPSNLDLDEIRNLAHLCGITLARAHARSGQSKPIDQALSSPNSLEWAMTSFAEHYQEQVKSDYIDFKTALSSMRLAEATEDVLPPRFLSNADQGIFVDRRAHAR